MFSKIAYLNCGAFRLDRDRFGHCAYVQLNRADLQPRRRAAGLFPRLLYWRNPFAWTATEYTPGTSAGNKKSPAPFVVVSRTSPVRSLVSFTSASGITGRLYPIRAFRAFRRLVL